MINQRLSTSFEASHAHGLHTGIRPVQLTKQVSVSVSVPPCPKSGVAGTVSAGQWLCQSPQGCAFAGRRECLAFRSEVPSYPLKRNADHDKVDTTLKCTETEPQDPAPTGRPSGPQARPDGDVFGGSWCVDLLHFGSKQGLEPKALKALLEQVV